MPSAWMEPPIQPNSQSRTVRLRQVPAETPWTPTYFTVKFSIVTPAAPPTRNPHVFTLNSIDLKRSPGFRSLQRYNLPVPSL